jgi:hypothetical protein
VKKSIGAITTIRVPIKNLRNYKDKQSKRRNEKSDGKVERHTVGHWSAPVANREQNDKAQTWIRTEERRNQPSEQQKHNNSEKENAGGKVREEKGKEESTNSKDRYGIADLVINHIVSEEAFAISCKRRTDKRMEG